MCAISHFSPEIHIFIRIPYIFRLITFLLFPVQLCVILIPHSTFNMAKNETKDIVKEFDDADVDSDGFLSKEGKLIIE